MMVNRSPEFEIQTIDRTFEKFISGLPPSPKKTVKKLKGMALIVSSLQ